MRNINIVCDELVWKNHYIMKNGSLIQIGYC